MTRLVILGAGVVGAAAAFRAARRGAEVTVVDGAYPGTATAAGAGIVGPSPGLLADDALLPLVRHSLDRYPELIAELAADGVPDTGYAVVGALRVAVDAGEAEQLAVVAGVLERARDAGISHIGDVELLGPAEARGAFPPLGPVTRAVRSSAGARVDGRRLQAGLLEAATRCGAELCTGVARIQVTGGRVSAVQVGDRQLPADRVLLATGAWTNAVLEPAGVGVPVGPQRGQIAHLQFPEPAATDGWPTVGGFHTHYLLAFPGGRVVAGATRESAAGFDLRVTAAGVAEVFTEALRIAPGLAAAELVEIRVGFRPASRDGRPLLGPVSGLDNVVLATGHGPSGLTLGPYSGELAADLALGGSAPFDLSPFRPAR